jgi:cytochrome c biogenesis protein CcdA
VSLTLVLAVLGIAVVDSVNPSALAMTSYLIARPDTWSNVRAYIAGIFTLYFAIGLVVVFAFGRAVDTIVDTLSSPAVPYGIEALIGVVALIFAARRPRTSPSSGPRAPAALTPSKAFGLGLTITAIESTTAIPYLGALAAISRADPPPAATFALLLAYNLVFIAPPVLLALTARYASGRLLERLSKRRTSPPGPGRSILRVACGLVGIVLLVDAGLFFLTDAPLFPA